MRWLVLMSLFGVFVMFTMGISGQSLVIVILAVAITLVVVYYEGKLKPSNPIEHSSPSNSEPDAKGGVDSGVELIKLINQQGYDLLSPLYFDSCKEFNALTSQEKHQSILHFNLLLDSLTGEFGSVKNIKNLPQHEFLILHEKGIFAMEVESSKRIARQLLFQSLSLFVQYPEISNYIVQDNWDSLLNSNSPEMDDANISLFTPDMPAPQNVLNPADAWPFPSNSRP